MAEVTLPALRSIEISTSKAGWAAWGEREGAQMPVVITAVAEFPEHFLHAKL